MRFNTAFIFTTPLFILNKKQKGQYNMSTKHSTLTGSDLHYSKIKTGSGVPNGNSFATTTGSIVGDVYLDTDTQTTWVRKFFTGSNDWVAAPFEHAGSHRVSFTTTADTTITLPPSGTLLSSTSVGVVTSSMILNSTIIDEDINGGANIVHSKLIPLTASRAAITNGSGVLAVSSVTSTELTPLSGIVIASGSIESRFAGKQPVGNYMTGVTGAVTGSGAGIVNTTLNDNVVTTPKIADNSVTVAKIANLPAASAVVVTDGSSKLTTSAITTTKLGYLSDVSSNIGAALAGKQATGNYITELTGEVTALGPGIVAATIGANKVTTPKIIDGAVTDAKIASTPTSANTASTIVKRDGSGNFAANFIDVNRLSVIAGTNGTLDLASQTGYPLGRALYGRLWSQNSGESLCFTRPSGFCANLSFGGITANRDYSFPNVSGALITTGDVGTITNGMILDDSITNIKLKQINTPGKVTNLSTTATPFDSPNTIVGRDSNGDFATRAITTSRVYIDSVTNTGEGFLALKSQSADPTGLALHGKLWSAAAGSKLAYTFLQGGVTTQARFDFGNISTTTEYVFGDSGGEIITNYGTQFLNSKSLSSPSIFGNSSTPAAGYLNLSTQNTSNLLQLTGTNGRVAGISTSGLTASRLYTLPDASGNIVLDSAQQNLTNKAVTISGATNTNDGFLRLAVQSGLPPALAGHLTINADTTTQLRVVRADGIAAQIAFSSMSANQVYTFPNATGNIVLNSASQVLSQKSFSDNVSALNFSATGTAGAGYLQLSNQVTVPSGVTGSGQLFARNTSQALGFVKPSGVYAELNFASISSNQTYNFPNDGANITTDIGAQTLTNKTISGASNTFSNIPNAAVGATSANVVNKIVTRDAFGDFASRAQTIQRVFVYGALNNGDGYIELATQSNNPAGVAGASRLWNGGFNAASLLFTKATGTWSELSFNASTANRTYTFPDVTGNVLLDTTNIPASQVIGRTNGAPTTGYIGQQIRPAYVSSLTVTSGTIIDVTSIPLTAGVWDVSVMGVIDASTCTASELWISTTVASTTGRVLGDNYSTQTGKGTHVIPSYRITLTSSQTFYLITFAIGTGLFISGRISATRVG